MKHLTSKVFITFTIVLLLSISCERGAFIPDYTNTGGFVIGREICKADEAEDYWLVDLTYYPNTPPYGDTLTINGTTYINVVKVKTLASRLKQIGMRVSFDFKTITPNAITTTGCTVSNPVTYNLKELFVINQGEIR
jgi:hypothetical protein